MFETREIGESTYASLLESVHPKNLYQTQKWLAVLKGGFGVETKLLETRSPVGDLLAVTPFTLLRKGGLRLIGTPLRGTHTEFMGPIFFENEDKEILSEIIYSQHHFLVRTGYKYIEWGFKSGEGELLSVCFQKLGYSPITRNTMIVDLAQGEERLWKSFEGRARNMIRKSIKSGVSVEQCLPTKELVKEYYKMLETTFRRQKRFPPHPESFYQKMRQNLSTTGDLKFVRAKKNNSVIAAAFFLQWERRILFLSGTSNTVGAKYAANSLIQWHTMKNAILEGMTEYDMGGIGNERIDKFKSSFKGRIEKHQVVVYRKWYLALIERLYSQLAGKGLVRIHARR